jgi:hypothetical protein
MFSDVQHFRDLTHHDFTQLRFDGAQEYEDKFKKNFGFNINKKIKANRVERYNPKNDFTIQQPQSYTDEVRNTPRYDPCVLFEIFIIC